MPDVLALLVLREPRRAELASVAGAAEATPLGLGHVRVVVVDPDGAVPERGRDPLGARRIGGPDRTGQSELGVVAELDGFLLGAEALDRQQRTEHLLADHPHVAGAVREDRRAVEEARLQVWLLGSPPARDQPPALRQRRRHVVLDPLALLGGHQRPGLGARVQPVAQTDPLGTGGYAGDDGVVHLVLHDQPGARRADLPGVQEDRRQGVVDHRVEVGVGEHDVGVLAAELDRDPLHRLGRRAQDRLPRRQPSGERDHVHRLVRHQRRPDRAGAQHEVHRPCGNARLHQQLHQLDGGQWGQLAGLDDDGAACREGRRQLPGDLQQRVVPGRDQRAHADRFADDAADHLRPSGVDQPPAVLAGQRGVVGEHADHVVDVQAALGQGLARVEGLRTGDLLPVAHQQPRDPGQQRPPLAGGGTRPRTGVERCPRRQHGAVDVSWLGLVDLRHDALVEGVDDLVGDARGAGGPAASDQQRAGQPFSHAWTLPGLSATHFLAAASGVILSSAMYLATRSWSSLVQVKFLMSE